LPIITVGSRAERQDDGRPETESGGVVALAHSQPAIKPPAHSEHWRCQLVRPQSHSSTLPDCVPAPFVQRGNSGRQKWDGVVLTRTLNRRIFKRSPPNTPILHL